MMESDADWCCDVNDINSLAIRLSSTDVVQHSVGVSKSKPQLLFRHQKQNVRAWQLQFGRHCIWNNSGRFGPKEESNSNWEDKQSFIKMFQKPVLYKRSEPIEKNFTSFGTRLKMDIFHFMLRSYWPNGSRDLWEIFTRIECANVQKNFDGPDSTQPVQVGVLEFRPNYSLELN